MIIKFSCNFKFDHLFVMCTRMMRDFVVVELGAGWGRWSLDTIFLAKRLGIKARAICVEAGKRPLLSAFSLPPRFVFVYDGNPKASLV